MKRTAIILAAAACLAAAENDHAILERGLGGRAAELESDLYHGKAAVYRPVRLPIRISAATGEGCASRLSAAHGVITIDWRTVRGLELGEAGGKTLLYLRRSTEDGKLIIEFASREEATPVLLAMERLRTACKAADPLSWP